MAKRKRFFEPDDAQNQSESKKIRSDQKVNPAAEKRLIQAKAKAPPLDEKQKVLNRPKVAKFKRGLPLSVKGIKDKKLKSQLKSKESIYAKSALTAAKVEQWLLPSEGGTLEAEGNEHTYDYTQEDIVREVDISSAHKAFDLKLPILGPYTLDFTHNGRYGLIGGRKGHLAIIDWKTSYLITETQVRETTRDVKFLHNEQFFAAAQKKYIYIYDKKGAEVHCLKEYVAPLKLEFLRQHFLLVSINKSGILHYQDMSTGEIVANHHTKLGRSDVIRANPYNAVVGVGHSNGTVTMWTPNLSAPVVTMLCNKGGVTSVAFDMGGNYMVTAGTDAKIKVFDVRKLQPLTSYVAFQPTKSLEISQKGLLAVGSGSSIEIWQDAFNVKQEKPYMKHKLPLSATVQDLCFCPYEDVLGIGHSGGVSSMIVPGAGEPNYDTFVANPYEMGKQRREAEVHALLDKLQPELIMWDPHKVGTVKKNFTGNLKQLEEQEKIEAELKEKQLKEKKKTKGRNKIGKRVAKKQKESYSQKRLIIRHQQHQQNHNQQKEQSIKEEEPLPRALARFS